MSNVTVYETIRFINLSLAASSFSLFYEAGGIESRTCLPQAHHVDLRLAIETKRVSLRLGTGTISYDWKEERDAEGQASEAQVGLHSWP